MLDVLIVDMVFLVNSILPLSVLHGRILEDFYLVHVAVSFGQLKADKFRWLIVEDERARNFIFLYTIAATG